MSSNPLPSAPSRREAAGQPQRAARDQAWHALSVEGQRATWPWANDAVFWGMNVGLVGFAIGLITETPILEQVFTPIMGLAILLAIVMYAWLLLRRPATAAGVAFPA